MDRAARETEHTICVLSPNYIQSHFTPPEWAAAFSQDPEGEKRKIIPVRVRPLDVEGLLSSIVYIDLVGLDETEAINKLLEGVLEGRSKPTTAPNFPSGKKEIVKTRFPGALPQIWNVPFNRNPNFTGRDEFLECLHKTLYSGKHAALTQAITGLGGMGKTQIGIEYAYRYSSEYDIIWWVRAKDSVTLLTDFLDLGNLLPSENKIPDDPRLKILFIRKWLEKNGNWLLIYDDAQNPEDIYNPIKTDINFLPQSATGHVLITSRNPNWTSIARPFNIQVFSQEEAVKFVQKRIGHVSVLEASELAKELGYLPLALEQAAAFIIETPGITVQRYLKIFRERHQQLWEKEKPPINYPETIATTWSISIEKIQEENSDAVDLLTLCAFFASDDIPTSIFKQAIDDELEFSEITKCLKKFSLIEGLSDKISVHRLVQLVTRDNLNESKRRFWISGAITLLLRTFDFNPDDPRTWVESSVILPHVLSVVAFAEKENIELESTAQLLGNLGNYLFKFADYDTAKEIDERALKIAEDIYGPTHENVASIANNLGLILKKLGDFEGAKKCLERALHINETLFGPEHESVAATENNLGAILQDLGYFKEAKSRYERSIAIYEKNGNFKCPEISKSINNLGRVLHDLGDFSHAKIQYERAFDIDKNEYGMIHPDVAQDINNIGLLLQDMGKPQKAKRKFEQSLKIYLELFGPNHPDVAISLNNYGRVLQDLGALSGAKKNLERALNIYENLFGKEYPEIARVANNLGVVLLDMQDYSGAKRQIERAISIDEKYYGCDHPEVATDLNNLGSVYACLENDSAAINQFERALMILENTYGLDHPNVARTSHCLGSVLFKFGDFIGAKMYLNQALRILKKLGYSENQETAKVSYDLGMVMLYLGEYSDAEIHFKLAHTIYEKELGPEDPVTKGVSERLKYIYPYKYNL